jgi:predicted ATP-grasp superfamily ATP-dependent carboligase
MKTVLLTGGRAPVTLELARMFKRQGNRVIVAESVRTHLCRASASVDKNYEVPKPRWNPDAFVAALSEIVVRERVDLLLPTCEEIFYVAHGCEKLEKLCSVFIEPLDKLRLLHNKWEFVQLARQFNLHVPETSLITSVAMLADVNFPIVFKPVFSRFASKVIIAHDPHPLIIQPTLEQPWVAQQLVYGQQLCTYSVAREGRILAHTTYLARFTAGQGAAIHFKHIEHLAAFEWVQKFVIGMNFTGQIAFDFIETETGELFSLECNPRATSGIHLLISNFDFANVFWNDVSGLVTPDPAREAMLALAMLIYGLPAAIAARTIPQWATAFTRSRDAAFSFNDPLPALWQLVSLLVFIIKGHRLGITPLEASTYDIEWNGEM